MAKKNLIIGAMTNYDFAQVRPWVRSINHCGFVGDKIMVVFNANYQTCDQLIEEGFKVIAVGKKDDVRGLLVHEKSKMPIHVERFLHIYEYLKDKWEDYEYVVTTDVKDVIFQHDPIRWMELNHIGKGFHQKLVAGSEAIQYKNEPWGNENLMQTYGAYIHDIFKEKEIYNVGVLGGTAEYMKDLALHILVNGINRPIPIVDQAVFNVLIQSQPFKDATLLASQRRGWACQAGTTVDPSKIESFRPHLLEGEPVWNAEEGIVCTSEGIQFCIVHQYDRVPEWKKVIEARYAD